MEAVNVLALEEADLKRLDEIYVRKQDCNDNLTAEHEKITEIKVIQAKTNTKLSIVIGILSAISVPVITICVKFLFEK